MSEQGEAVKLEQRHFLTLDYAIDKIGGQPRQILLEVNAILRSQQAQIEALTAKLGRQDQYRDLLLWALYHHQGGSSEIGQPIRRSLGIGQFDELTPAQIAAARSASGVPK